MAQTPLEPEVDKPAGRLATTRIGQFLQRHEFIRHVLTLMTGTAFAQVIGLAVYPIITRQYSADDMGVFSMYMSFVGFLVTIAALRYDLAIVPAASDDEARSLISLATRINIGISIATTVILGLGAEIVAAWVRTPRLAPWLWLVGPLVFVTAQVTILGYWLNRKKAYRIVSTNQMLISSTMSGTRVGFGLLGTSVWGLVASQFPGQIFALLRLVRKTRADISQPRTSTRRAVAAKFKRMPLVNGPNAVIDAIRLNGIPMLIGRFFSTSAVGNFAVAWLLIQAPLSLINGALSQVFFQKMSVTPRGQMFSLVRMSLVRSILLGIVPFALIYFLAPPVLPWVLGASYQNVGAIAAALVPWLFFNLATSPVSMLFIVVQKQGVMLLFSIAYMITPLTILWFYHENIVATMQVVSLAMGGLLVIFCVLALWAAKQYDVGRTPDLSLPQE